MCLRKRKYHIYITIETLYSVCWQQLQPSWVHLYLGSFSYSSLQILSTSVRLEGECCSTSSFRSLQRCSIGFKSGLWLGHSRTFRDLSQSHPCVVLAVCLGLLSCWKVNISPSLRSWALCSRFSSKISLYFPSILSSLPVPAAEKHHQMMLAPPCFTVEMVPGFLQTWRLSFRPKSSILVLSDQRNLFLMFWEYFRCLLANSKRAVMCLLLRSGFCLATTIKACLVECCRDGCPSGRFSHFHRGTLELCQSDHRFHGHLPYQGLSTRLLSLAGRPALEESR